MHRSSASTTHVMHASYCIVLCDLQYPTVPMHSWSSLRTDNPLWWQDYTLNTRHSRVTPASVIISSTYMHYLLLLAQSSSSSTILKTHETASSLHLGISPTPDPSATSRCQLLMVMAPLWPPPHPVQDHRNPIPRHEVLMEVILDIRAWFWGNSCSVSLSVQLKTRHER